MHMRTQSAQCRQMQGFLNTGSNTQVGLHEGAAIDHALYTAAIASAILLSTDVKQLPGHTGTLGCHA